MDILVADHHPEVCAALRLFLEQDAALAVADEVTDVQSALAVVEALQPDLVLLDWELSGGPTPSMILAVRALSGDSRIVVLSGLPEARQQAIAAGADAFVSKLEPPERLRRVVLALAADEAGWQAAS